MEHADDVWCLHEPGLRRGGVEIHYVRQSGHTITAFEPNGPETSIEDICAFFLWPNGPFWNHKHNTNFASTETPHTVSRSRCVSEAAATPLDLSFPLQRWQQIFPAHCICHSTCCKHCIWKCLDESDEHNEWSRWEWDFSSTTRNTPVVLCEAFLLPRENLKTCADGTNP